MTSQWGDLKSSVSGTVFWKNWLHKAKAHQEALAVIGIIVIVVALFVPYYLRNKAQSEKDAAGVLNLGQYYLRANVDPQNGPFKSEAEKYQQCLQTFQRIKTDFPGTSSSKLAEYYLAKCQYFMGQYAQSYSEFDEASRQLKGTPLGDEAQVGQILSLIAQKQWDQSRQLAMSFLSGHPGSFLVPEVKLDLSDIYLQLNDKEKAVAELKEVAGSTNLSWSQEASRRLKNLQS
jgi:tetratricopeptide (TPR) repeat protein